MSCCSTVAHSALGQTLLGVRQAVASKFSWPPAIAINRYADWQSINHTLGADDLSVNDGVDPQGLNRYEQLDCGEHSGRTLRLPENTGRNECLDESGVQFAAVWSAHAGGVQRRSCSRARTGGGSGIQQLLRLHLLGRDDLERWRHLRRDRR